MNYMPFEASNGSVSYKLHPLPENALCGDVKMYPELLKEVGLDQEGSHEAKAAEY